MESSVRHWEISAAVIEPLTSCLLARIRTAAFCKSYVEKTREDYKCCFQCQHLSIEHTLQWKPQKMSLRELGQQRTATSAEYLNTCQHAESRSLG